MTSPEYVEKEEEDEESPKTKSKPAKKSEHRSRSRSRSPRYDLSDILILGEIRAYEKGCSFYLKSKNCRFDWE